MKYIIALDQSTSGTKAALYDSNLNPVKTGRMKHRQYYPKPGWVEHDAEEILQNTKTLLESLGSVVDLCDIAAVGIANQRETAVLWERATGKPVTNAVVWQDVRAQKLTDEMKGASDYIFSTTGLTLSPYYSAAKVSAVLSANPDIKKRAERGEICFGTVDSYLIYRLTGGRHYACDISNAGRTQLFDIRKLEWDKNLALLFGIPFQMLPENVLSSDAAFGKIETVDSLKGVEIHAVMGDSNSALFGHGCLEKGMVKASYGTGSSVMMNVGETAVFSRNGLSSSIGFRYRDRVSYVLEGNVTSSGDTLCWLKDGLGLISSMDELNKASEVYDTDGVYLVPAFSGLGAPWFESSARAIIFGMNRGTTKAHVIRAAAASIAHQNADILDAMMLDTSSSVTILSADGGAAVNRLIMQMQSDYIPCTVSVPEENEMTLYGVALMAALSSGLVSSMPEGRKCSLYTPLLPEEKRIEERKGWKDALDKCR